MKNHHEVFFTHALLHDLKHYLPAQAPLKDFIHHNTLHAFQSESFFDALRKASVILGYKTLFTLEEYRKLYEQGKIDEAILERVVQASKGEKVRDSWIQNLKTKTYNQVRSKRIGSLRHAWKQEYRIDLNALVHPDLFRILNSYLDQGIAIWRYPVTNDSFLGCVRALEGNGFTSFFTTSRAKKLVLDENIKMEDLLKILVGDESLYAQYVFDQQFSHPGWSGMVSTIEDLPQSLLDTRNITLHELILLELILEIDRLDTVLGNKWAPLGSKLELRPRPLFDNVPVTELDEVLALWQEAYEWTYHDQVLGAIQLQKNSSTEQTAASFQALFCIDDRSCSLRRYIELQDPNCATYGTPGHFGIPTYYRPEHGKFNTKICPAPVTPKHLIKELGAARKNTKDMHFTRHTHGLVAGWLITHTIGFWSAMRLLVNVFWPSTEPSKALSAQHMSAKSNLTVEHTAKLGKEDGLQVGFTIPEMTDIVKNVLISIGLTKDFAPIVYVVGHGSSSVNNTHYAGYDCGACSGRPGSVNARSFSKMANHAEVRKALVEKGISIPAQTLFLGALHDTSRDEISFFDEELLSGPQVELHAKNHKLMILALDQNAKERSRRFELINTGKTAARIHDKVRTRTVSLFEPRPELNHATNALCIVGRRDLTHGIFLDRRSFLNSYDYRLDADGAYLLNILKAAAPVCGGINLEYFFSRVDNHKLGAGTKLPHNVMGLIGVANGIGGDLRPGLPSQMIEVHDPVRLLLIVEHLPETVLKTIKSSPETYEWFENAWVHLAVVHPETRAIALFQKGEFVPYLPLAKRIEHVSDITPLLEKNVDNMPVYLMQHA
jgi:uncharacterized protein YbcC (UPF0753/DUF2309 family)